MNYTKLKSVALVLTIVGFQFASLTYYLMKILRPKYSAWAIVLEVFLCVLMILLVWAYLYSVYLDPGFIPLSNEDDFDSSQYNEYKARSKNLKQKVRAPNSRKFG